MIVWLTIAVLAGALVLTASVVVIFRLTSSIGSMLTNVVKTEQECIDFTRLLRKVALFSSVVLLLNLVPFSLLYTTVGSGIDQTLRNLVDRWMSGSDLFRHISLNEDQYRVLPLEWRQTLAEIMLRPEGEALDAIQVAEKVTVEDLELIGRLAPFAVNGGYIARDEQFLSEHPIPGVSYEDMRRLEELGIVDDVNFGMEFPLTSKGNDPGTVQLLGTTILIEAKGSTHDIQSTLKLTRLTVAGKTLMNGLRVPSNVEYFEWIANRMELDGWTVRLIAVGTDSGNDIAKRTMQGEVNRDSIANWSADLPTR